MGTISQATIDRRVESGSKLWLFLKRELAPTPDRLSYSIRVAISAAIIVLTAETGRSQQLFLALFLLLLLPRDSPKQTSVAALAIFVIATTSSAIAIALAMLVADITWARVICIGLTIFTGMILGRGLRQPLVGVLFPVILIQALISLDVTNNVQAIVESILWLTLMMSFGVTVAVAVEFLYPHPTPLQRVLNGIVDRLETIAAVLNKAGGDDEFSIQRRAAGIAQLALTGSGPLRKLLPAISSRHLLNQNNQIRLNTVLSELEGLTDLASNLFRYDRRDITPSQKEFCTNLARFCMAFADCVKRQEIAEPCIKAGRAGGQAAAEGKATVLLTEMSVVLERLREGWYQEAQLLGEQVEPLALTHKEQKTGIGPFFSKDNLRFAIKVTLASMICYVIYNGVAWQGISTSLITCFIVALDTVGATFRKLALRLIGSSLGGLVFGIAGISFFLSHFDNVAELLIYVAFVFFVAGWVTKGSQRISYAGVQIGLSFSLVALGSPVIPSEIVQPRDRIVGVLLGGIVMWYVFGRLWPVDALSAQRAKIAGLVGNVIDLIKLAESDTEAQVKISKLGQIRDVSGQAIFAANDQAAAAGYDSKYNAGVQDALRDCLSQAQALLMLEMVDVERSARYQTAEQEMRPFSGPLSEIETACLALMAQHIRTGLAADPGEFERRRSASHEELKSAADSLGKLASVKEGDEKRQIEGKVRMLVRRQELLENLAASSKELVSAVQIAARKPLLMTTEATQG